MICSCRGTVLFEMLDTLNLCSYEHLFGLRELMKFGTPLIDTQLLLCLVQFELKLDFDNPNLLWDEIQEGFLL